MKKKWAIIIPTVVNRAEKFQRLVDALAPQVAKYRGAVEVIIFWNNYERELSELRQLALTEVNAEYCNFIDDDDLVSEDYVDSIYPLLDGEVDYIGFRVAFYQGGEKQRPVIHSLTCEKWEDTGEGFYRRGTLINPTKASIMKKVGFKDSDYRKNIPEDITYAKNVDPYLKSEHFVDKEVHIYLPTDDHAWRRFEPLLGVYRRPDLPKYFRFHPGSTQYGG